MELFALIMHEILYLPIRIFLTILALRPSEDSKEKAKAETRRIRGRKGSRA